MISKATLLHRIVGRVDHAVSELGVLEALRLGLAITYGGLRERLHPQYRAKREEFLSFDRKYNVTTGQRWYVSDMVFVHSQNKRHAVRHEPVQAAELKGALHKSAVDHSEFTFVDLGSGMGKGMFVAADYPFKEIVGVEFCPELHRICEQNIRSYHNPQQRCRQIRALNCDAAEYEFPSTPLVLYCYCPFYAPVLKPVMQNLRRSYEKNPRPMVVLWITVLEPEQKQILDAQPFLSLAREHDETLIYKTPDLCADSLDRYWGFARAA